MTDSKPVAIIIGLDSMQGLQSARILRDRGVSVVGIAGDSSHHACSTNACQTIYFCDTSTRDLVRFLRKIRTRFTTNPVLIPCQDASVRVLSAHRDALDQHFHINLADASVVDMLVDKDSFDEYARGQNLPLPQSYILTPQSDVNALVQQISYPCLFKPRVRTAKWKKNTNKKAFKIDTPDDLVYTFDRCRSWADAFLVQQWIPGDDTCLYSCNVYFDRESRPIVTFVARKLRQWPPETGSSCLGEEVRNDVVLDTTLELFRNLGYKGLGYLEMKRDPNTGQHFIIEPNVGRPTGRSAIAEAGGVELLYTMYCDTVGLPLPPNRTQTYGQTKWIDLRHDIQSAYVQWRSGNLTLIGWWRSIRGRKGFAVFSWRDPVPFFADIRRVLSILISGRRQHD